MIRDIIKCGKISMTKGDICAIDSIHVYKFKARCHVGGVTPALAEYTYDE